ncbi:hypothetical protein D3C80_1912560 [compost metagenome]
MDLSLVRFAQGTPQVFYDSGFDFPFIGALLKHCTGRRCFTVSRSINRHDTARPAAGMPAQGQATLNRATHHTQAITG